MLSLEDASILRSMKGLYTPLVGLSRAMIASCNRILQSHPAIIERIWIQYEYSTSFSIHSFMGSNLKPKTNYNVFG